MSKFTLKTPCKDCPFRTDIMFYLPASRVKEICESITLHQQSFLCHKTTKFNEDGETIQHKDEIHCAGALIMLEHMEMPNQMMRIAERCGYYDRTKLDMDAPVFESDNDMIAEYEDRSSVS